MRYNYQRLTQRENRRLALLTYEGLRKKYPAFIFEKFEVSESPGDLEIRYFFEIPGLDAFSPVWHFSVPEQTALTAAADRAALCNLIFSLGMTELISYWKLACPPRVEIRAGHLDAAQAAFWKKQYFLGLGEFFYTNGITANIGDFMEITSAPPPSAAAASLCAAPTGGDACLIPIGGGKDSAVTLEILKQSGSLCYGYAINPGAASLATYKAAGLPAERLLVARRTLDDNLLRLNAAGYLNGHTPFSALVAFSSVLQAYLYGVGRAVLSNEASANESTVAGTDVNHQYSKSFEFERDFIGYEKAYIGSGVSYFSLLRPLTEFQIARLFAGYRQYHSIFRSCNAGSKTGVWCGVCAKCLFVYVILSPFLPPDCLRSIFGGSLLDYPVHRQLLDKLTGVSPEKPFECVGNRAEVNIALCLTAARAERERRGLPALLAYYIRTPLYETYKSRVREFDDYYNTENALPERFDELLRRVLK
jgi:hypothetical protein